MGKNAEERKSAKRKRNDDEDHANNVKAKKRREDYDEDSFQLPEDIYNEARDDPSDWRDLSLENRAGQDNYVIYLIRKPVRLSIDQLADVSLPKKAKKVKKIELKTDDGTFMVQTGALCDKMMHVSSETACGLNSKAVSPDGMVSGLITITPTTPVDLPLLQIFEEGEEISENVELPGMKSVRKKPRTKAKYYNELSERLVAYGIEPQNGKRNTLPGLKLEENQG